MEVANFIQFYREAFGNGAPLPIALSWTAASLGEPEKDNACMFASLSRIREGQPVSFGADTRFCGGGKLYCGFVKPSAAVGRFVADVEHYKATPESVMDSISMQEIQEHPDKYVTFRRLDLLDSWENIEGLIFLASMDLLSGLWSWAHYDIEKDDAIVANFGSGCSSIISNIMRENKNNGYRCFIGMLDISARPFIKANEAAFSIPRCRLLPMLETFTSTALFRGKAWRAVRERLEAAESGSI